MNFKKRRRENSDCDSLFKWNLSYDDSISTSSHNFEDENWGKNSAHYLLLGLNCRIYGPFTTINDVRFKSYYKL